jgi:DNA-binding XRE family transcriptional regulator
MTDHVRLVPVSDGAVRFDAFLRERAIKHAVAGRALGVSRQTILAWRTGAKPPDEKNRIKVENFCARVDDRGAPILRDDGRVESHVPREAWPAKPVESAVVQPYDARPQSDRPEAAP